MRRLVEPELLDELPSSDPRAIGSRADLRRLNLIMGHVGIFSGVLRVEQAEAMSSLRSLRWVELGAGDGTLLLQLARRWSKFGIKANVTLIDRQDLVSRETHRGFIDLGWSVECRQVDVFSWLENFEGVVDIMLANLFLHHFQTEILSRMLQLVARRAHSFAACEPRRSSLSYAASRGLWLIGCNAVTRHDARVSVRSGFSDQELSALWPSSVDWELAERAAGFFSHCFTAKRRLAEPSILSLSAGRGVHR